MQPKLLQVRSIVHVSPGRTHPQEAGLSGEELADLISNPRFDKTFDFYQVLARASEKEVVKLQVAETLLSTANERLLFLSTDGEGVVRGIADEQCSLCSTQQLFMSLSTAHNKRIQNLNPQGIRFPRYLTFSGGAVQYSLMRSSDLKRYRVIPGQKVQRYLMPEDGIAQKKIVHWRRTKVTKMFLVSSRVTGKAKKMMGGLSPLFTSKLKALESPSNASEPVARLSIPFSEVETFSLDFAFVASLHNPKVCNVTREKRKGEETDSMLSVVKGLVETYVLGPGELLDELVFSLMKSQDGIWYFLNCTRAKVVRLEDNPKVNSKHPAMSLTELSSRITDTSHISEIRNKSLPGLNLKDISDISTELYYQQLRSSSPKKVQPPQHFRSQSDVKMSVHLQQVADMFDRLKTESQALKKAYRITKTVQFMNYPVEFLGNVIRKVYDSIGKDPRLSKYFPDKQKIQTHIESAVRHVFVHNVSKSQIREIHRSLNVSDTDFNAYVQYFVDVLTSEWARSDDIEKVRLFLEDFRTDVVPRMKIVSEHDGEEET